MLFLVGFTFSKWYGIEIEGYRFRDRGSRVKSLISVRINRYRVGE
jgi:hypothetical protein